MARKRIQTIQPETPQIGGAVLNADGSMTPVSVEDAAVLRQQQDEEDQRQARIIKDFTGELKSKCDKVIRSKRYIEKRWIDDQRQMSGDVRLMDTKQFPSQTNDDHGKPPVPHYTRARSQLWASRMIDCIAPTNDPTWQLRPLVDEDTGSQMVDYLMADAAQLWQQRQQDAQKAAQSAQPPAPAPDPNAPPDPNAAAQGQPPPQPGQPPAQPQAPQPGQPPQPADQPTEDELRNLLREVQEGRARKMAATVKDQLVACGSTESTRRMCDHAVELGTGLLIGPSNGRKIRRRWNGQGVVVSSEEVLQPEVTSGDPWCFYPDMTPTADKAQFAFYLHLMGELELRDLATFPGFDEAAVMKALKEKPDYGEVQASLVERNNYSGFREETAGRWPVWRYTGIVDEKYREVLKINEDDHRIIFADVWYCGENVLKAKILPLAHAQDFRIPYFVFAPFKVDDTMFGASIPYLCRDSQRMATAALWILLHNASASSGPQIIYRPGKISPMDGKYSTRGPKMWKATDDQTPLNDLFYAINIPNNVDQALGILNLAKQTLDEELNTAQWASPDTSEETQTASGLAMLMNSRTILQRRVCACADDQVYKPMIERFVLWNNLFNKREDIKGNFDVNPLCQSVRLVKDIQIQQKLFVASQMAQNPMFAGMFSTYDMVQDILRDLDVQVENWLTPRDKWMQIQAQQSQQNPQAQLQQQVAQSQIVLNQAKAKTEGTKQQKMFSDAQSAQQGQTDDNWKTMQLQQQHEQFLTNAQLKMQEGDRVMQQNAQNNQTKLQLAAFKAQAEKDKSGTVLDSSARRERTELIKAGVQAKVNVHTANIKASKPPAAPKTPAAPKFVAPKAPRYSGGKRPAS